MANVIKVKRSAVAGKVPLTTDLQLGEIAINTFDGKVYTKRNDGTDSVVEVAAYTVNTAPPSKPVDGDRYFDTDTGIEYVYLDDGTSSQWVETGAPGVGEPGAPSDVTLAGNNAFTGANTFTNVTGQIFRPAATQDGILIRGRAGGTTSLTVELVPTTLTASRTLTFPDVSGTAITTGDTGTVTNTMLAGSIANNKLTNSTITVNSASTALGGSVTLFAGTTTLQTASANQALTGISSVTLPGATSGSVQIIPAATAGTGTVLTLPATTGTAVTTGDTGTVTNTMLAGSIANNKLSNSTITVNSASTALGGSVTLFAGTTTLQTASANQALTGISSVTLPGATSGSVQIIPSATAGTGTVLTLPATTGTAITSGDTNTVTNTMLAQIATASFKGRATAGTGNVEDLTGTQATALLNTFTSTLKGLAPASGGGTTNFLRADGTWAAPAGGASLSANNAFTGANTFTNTTGQIFRQAATQDGVLLRGRAGGTTSLTVELAPATLTASRTLTLPNVDGTVVTTGDTGTVTNTMLAGSIGNTKLTNSAITVNGSSTSLGGSVSLFAGTTTLQTSSANQALTGISSVTLPGATSGSVQIIPAATAGTGTVLTLPATTGTAVTTGDTGSVTGTMIATETITNTNVSLTAAISGTKISPDFGAQLIQTSANPGLSLTGTVTGATTNQGVLAQGTLGFSGARVGANFADTQTQYYQVILQNKSSNTNASCDFVVCNDASTDSTTYGNFGINSSTYSGTGVFNQPNSVYLTSNGGPLGIGTITANDIRFSYNGEATDSLTIGATAATFGKTVLLRTGTATDAPLDFTGGTLLTTPLAGAVEYDGTSYYCTPTTTSGRGQIPSLQTFRLTANGTAIGGTIADFFGANSSINLAATSVYDIEAMIYLQKNTAGTLTWTWTASSAPTLITSMFWAGPVTGIAAGTPTTLYTGSRGATTAAFGATGSVSNNAFMAYQFKAQVITNLATNFRLRITCSAGTVTPQAGSFYRVSQISTTTGSFAA